MDYTKLSDFFGQWCWNDKLWVLQPNYLTDFRRDNTLSIASYGRNGDQTRIVTREEGLRRAYSKYKGGWVHGGRILFEFYLEHHGDLELSEVLKYRKNATILEQWFYS